MVGHFSWPQSGSVHGDQTELELGGEMLELRMELDKGNSQRDTNGKLGLSAGGSSCLDLAKYCTLLMF